MKTRQKPEPNPHTRQNLRFGLLIFAGFAVIFAICAVVVGSHLDHIDVSFSAAGVETGRERLDPEN